MSVVQAAVLGVVQGLTEFLPISSSGHLIVFPELLHWESPGLVFDVAVHVATLFAIVIALRHEVGSLARNVVKGRREDRHLLGKLLVATLPAIAVGALLGDTLRNLHVMLVVGCMLIVWGVLLWVADARGKKSDAQTVTKVSQLTWVQAIVIGVFQAFALVPGTSRSGATITGARFLGMERAQAVRFSFLLAIPAILAAAAKTFYDAYKIGYQPDWAIIAVGFVAAMLSGVLAIKLLFAVIRRTSFAWFAVYRILFGGFLIWIALT